MGIFDIQQLLDNFLAAKFTDGLVTEVLINNIAAYQRGDKNQIKSSANAMEESFQLHDVIWTLRITPYQYHMQKAEQMPQIVLAFGTVPPRHLRRRQPGGGR